MIKKTDNWFRKFHANFVLLYPILTALIIIFFRMDMYSLAFFILLLEISFVQGFRDDMNNPKWLRINFLMGIIISFFQTLFFIELSSQVKIVVAFPLYLWAWTSMYQAGLYTNPKNVNDKNLQSIKLTTLASIGTVCWIWLTL